MAKLDPVKKQMLKDADHALRVIGNDLMSRVVPLIPVDEGTLRGSAHVSIEHTPTTVTMTFSVDQVYAAAQHEGLDFVHPKGGQAKFVEEPFKQMLPRYEAALALKMGLH